MLEMRTVVPERSGQVLFNPGMGVYLPGGAGLSSKPPEEAWGFRIADIVYFRPGWADLEGDGPGSGTEAYFEPIFDYWVNGMGKRVAFRVMSESMHSRHKYVTPKWVFDAGVPGVRHSGLYAEQQIDPVFWNETYLDQYCRFVERLGTYLDGRRGLEFIDIGGIGEWGEMHLGLHIRGRWTSQQLDETGYSKEKYVAAYRKVIDVHARAFPRTRVFLNVGQYAHINDYAAQRGMHFRQDGLKPSGPSANVGKRFYHPYSRRGVICNYEFHSGYVGMQQKGWDLTETLRHATSDPVSYLNANIFSIRSWETAPDGVKRQFLDVARRIGYRFVLQRLRVSKETYLDGKRPGAVVVEHHWTNEGAAPCYESYAMEFTLHDSKGKTVASRLHFPDTATTLWWPGEEIVERTTVRVPADIPPGEYLLRVAMFHPQRADQHIRLDIREHDGDGRYLLCRIPARRLNWADAAGVQQSFETDGQGWRANRGVELSVDRRESHSGEASLRIEGTQSDAWNYAACTLPKPVYPGSKYRLSCWMKVNTIKPDSLAPYLKLGVTDGNGRWIANIVTEKCDPARLGQWQQLTGVFEMPSNAAGGHLAIEKGGDRHVPATVKLWLDDVRLVLLE